MLLTVAMVTAMPARPAARPRPTLSRAAARCGSGDASRVALSTASIVLRKKATNRPDPIRPESSATRR
ncbi:MAG: hypothetical protein JWP65_595 [Ramlibacter sp.]|nr:hypothetical protein [Ramlibacter sp.]